MAAEPAIVPSVADAVLHSATPGQPSSPTTSEPRSDDDDDAAPTHLAVRPPLGSRKSSGTMIVTRDHADAAGSDAEYDADDVRTMSPRRNSAEVAALSEDARRDLREQARTLQTSLQDIVTKMEAIKSEQEKLEAGNKFLQSYIGELMQTSKITSSAPKSKGKSRSGR